jgi:hypothetical protein
VSQGNLLLNSLTEFAIKDGKERFKGITNLEQILKAEDLSQVEGFVMNSVVSVLMPLLGDNDFKICQAVLGCIENLLAKSGKQLIPLLHILLDGVGEKLGDPKLAVRDKALEVIQRSMIVLSPAEVLEKLDALFQHRNWRVKEQVRVIKVQNISHLYLDALLFQPDIAKLWLQRLKFDELCQQDCQVT